jgi:hypothetical protein
MQSALSRPAFPVLPQSKYVIGNLNTKRLKMGGQT